MRRGESWAVWAMLLLAGCTSSEPFRDMVGYVPPTSLPAQPKRTLVQDEPNQVWDHLVTFLQQSDFEIDHIDPNNRLMVARYSGNPERYLDCGSIVTHENGALGEISGSAGSVVLNDELDGEPVLLKRALSLDSRIIIRLQEQSPGTVISTDTTYAVTKTVDIKTSSGGVREGSRETVNFSAGKRAEFSKGTACQPNGSLDASILQSLPNVIASNEIARADLPVYSSEQAFIAAPDQTTGEGSDSWIETDLAAIEGIIEDPLDAAIVPSAPDRLAAEALENDWIYTKPLAPEIEEADDLGSTTPVDRPQETPLSGSVHAPLSAQQSGKEAPLSMPTVTAVAPHLATVDVKSNANDTGSIIDESTQMLLATLDCQGSEWHFCDLVELTTPYRRRNIENAFGLTLNTAENFASQIVGSELKLDVDLPNFPSYLHIVYVDQDGMIDHVVSSSTLWPTDSTHRFQEVGHLVPAPSGLAMIVAVVSEEPLFASDQTMKEEAHSFLQRLERRLAIINASTDSGRIAASHLLINVEQPG